MKATKVMSIIGFVWFAICVLGAAGSQDISTAVGWTVFAVGYGIALAIVALVQSVNNAK